jgi:hypothetical protein
VNGPFYKKARPQLIYYYGVTMHLKKVLSALGCLAVASCSGGAGTMNGIIVAGRAARYSNRAVGLSGPGTGDRRTQVVSLVLQ